MVRRSHRGAPVRALLLGFTLVLASTGTARLLAQTPVDQSPHGMAPPSGMPVQDGTSSTPSAPGPGGTVPMDLTTGKTDMTPLSHSPVGLNEAFDPQTPPQTVEGTLVSVDPSGTEATVRTKGTGLVKVGLPPDVYVSRSGHESNLSEMKPGDQVFMTVETANGVRAVRVVSEPPTNPLISIIGIPVLLLIALAIWWSGRKRTQALAEPTAPARA